jgi:murein DD-endopeptidase MepM/ murein hydrolase activator NlpD
MREQPATNPAQDLFTDELRQLNGYTETELREWLFLPGMRFGDSAKWWKTGENRTGPHEGLDLLFFLDARGERHLLPPGTAIPPLLNGVVVTRAPDFMGETVILAHDRWDAAGGQLHTFYAHLQPARTPLEGKTMSAASKIGTIAGPKASMPACPPHLHLSLAWVRKAYPIKDFRWGDFCAGDSFKPGDPLELIQRTDRWRPG